MKAAELALLCAAVALLSLACNQGTPSTNTAGPAPGGSRATAKATPAEFAAAQATYQKNCESCHGEKAEGGIVKVDNKRLKVPSLKTDRTVKRPDADLIKQITAGGDGMPSFKTKLKPEEIQALVHLIRKEFQGQ